MNYVNKKETNDIISCGSLLQAASSEVMALRASRMYDPASRSIVLANRIPLTVSDMQATGQTIEYTEMVFKLCHDMADLNSDNAEYALFTAISIFSGMKRLQRKAEARFSDQNLSHCPSSL